MPQHLIRCTPMSWRSREKTQIHLKIMSEPTTTDNMQKAVANDALFGLCRDCKHWMSTPSTKGALAEYPRELPESNWWLDAVCNRIRFGLTIEASGGWNGATVDSIETDANFGCRYFEPDADVDASPPEKTL